MTKKCPVPFYLLRGERERDRERQRESAEKGRKRKREKDTAICYATYLCIHWLILLCVLTGMEPTILVYQDDALTN